MFLSFGSYANADEPLAKFTWRYDFPPLFVRYAPVMSHLIRKLSGDSNENVGMNVAPPPPGPSFSQVAATAFFLLLDGVLHAANAPLKIRSLTNQFNGWQF